MKINFYLSYNTNNCNTNKNTHLKISYFFKKINLTDMHSNGWECMSTCLNKSPVGYISPPCQGGGGGDLPLNRCEDRPLSPARSANKTNRRYCRDVRSGHAAALADNNKLGSKFRNFSTIHKSTVSLMCTVYE